MRQEAPCRLRRAATRTLASRTASAPVTAGQCSTCGSYANHIKYQSPGGFRSSRHGLPHVGFRRQVLFGFVIGVLVRKNARYSPKINLQRPNSCRWVASVSLYRQNTKPRTVRYRCAERYVDSAPTPGGFSLCRRHTPILTSRPGPERTCHILSLACVSSPKGNLEPQIPLAWGLETRTRVRLCLGLP